MYIPEHFAETNLPTLHEFMRQHSFATLVTQQDGVPFASHLPMFLDSSIGTHGALLGHMARNNAQWQDFAVWSRGAGDVPGGRMLMCRLRGMNPVRWRFRLGILWPCMPMAKREFCRKMSWRKLIPTGG
jgi:hypothetical protein